MPTPRTLHLTLSAAPRWISGRQGGVLHVLEGRVCVSMPPRWLGDQLIAQTAWVHADETHLLPGEGLLMLQAETSARAVWVYDAPSPGWLAALRRGLGWLPVWLTRRALS